MFINHSWQSFNHLGFWLPLWLSSGLFLASISLIYFGEIFNCIIQLTPVRYFTDNVPGFRVPQNGQLNPLRVWKACEKGTFLSTSRTFSPFLPREKPQREANGYKNPLWGWGSGVCPSHMFLGDTYACSWYYHSVLPQYYTYAEKSACLFLFVCSTNLIYNQDIDHSLKSFQKCSMSGITISLWSWLSGRLVNTRGFYCVQLTALRYKQR